MIRYAGLIENDVANGEGICVSLFLQGCDRKCKGCFNQETWDFNGGIEIDENELTNKILTAITKNGIQRNFSVLGGECLAKKNIKNTLFILKEVRQKYPKIKIFLWTGFSWNEILEDEGKKEIFNYVDYIIEGPYVEEKRNIALKWRGSENQTIKEKGIDFV